MLSKSIKHIFWKNYTCLSSSPKLYRKLDRALRAEVW